MEIGLTGASIAMLTIPVNIKSQAKIELRFTLVIKFKKILYNEITIM